MIYLNNVAIIKSVDAEIHIYIFKSQYDQIKKDSRTDKTKDRGEETKKKITKKKKKSKRSFHSSLRRFYFI